MGQILHLPGLPAERRPGLSRSPAAPQDALRRRDPAAAARGILLALAVSCIAWIAVALLVPRLW